MAAEIHVVPPKRRVFIGEDKRLIFPVYQDNATLVYATDPESGEREVVAGEPENVTSWMLRFTLRKRDKDPDPPVIEKDNFGLGGVDVIGTFSADPEINTQRVVVDLEDTDSNGLKPGRFRYSLKRMDEGNETIVAFGDFVWLQSTTR